MEVGCDLLKDMSFTLLNRMKNGADGADPHMFAARDKIMLRGELCNTCRPLGRMLEEIS
jgi:hypothetical protein